MKQMLFVLMICLLLLSGCTENLDPIPDNKSTETQSKYSKYEYSEVTYADCVNNLIEQERQFPPAKDELVGATRTDFEGNIWIKQEDGFWKTSDYEGYRATSWGDVLVDEQPGGIYYVPEELDTSECKQYMFTRNKVLEDKLTEIVLVAISDFEGSGFEISLEELMVLNLTGRSQASIKLNCEDNLDFDSEWEFVQNIATKIYETLPNEYGPDKESWVDVDCNYRMGFRISSGSSGPMI